MQAQVSDSSAGEVKKLNHSVKLMTCEVRHQLSVSSCPSSRLFLDYPSKPNAAKSVEIQMKAIDNDSDF